MSHYQKLKAMKTGFSSDFRTAIYARSISSKDYERAISGTPPLILSDSVGKPLVNWSITGNTVQDGEPTPEQPIEVKGVGDKTGNLFEPVFYDGANINAAGIITISTATPNNRVYIAPVTPGKEYTLSVEKYATFVLGYFTSKPVSGSQTYDKQRIVSSGGSVLAFNVPNVDAIKWVAIRTDIKGTAMLNEGSEPLPYEPYGYKVPVVSRGKNLCPPFVSGKRLDFTDGQEYISSNAICTDYFPIHFNNEFVRIGCNGFPNNVASCCFVYDKDFNFIGRAGNNVKEQISLKPEVFVNGQGTKAYDKIEYMRISISAPSYEGNVMVHYFDVRNLSEEIVPYEPYIEPITTPIYLNSPLMADEVLDSTGKREVEWGELVLTGDEQWSFETNNRYYLSTVIGTDSHLTNDTYCSHLPYNTNVYVDAGTQIGIVSSKSGIRIRMPQTKEFDTVSEFKSFLRTEYEKGTPVTVYYPLAAPTSETVDVPQIPTLKGNCVLDVDTEVQPTNMTVTYKSRR